MALLVEMTFDGVDDEGTRMWKNWCLRYLCQRFHDMTRWEWVPALALLDEEWLWHGDRNLKAFEYLQKIRNMAVYFVSKNHLEGRKGVDI